MIATLEQFKQYLWITDDDKDTLLQLILDGVNDLVLSYIGRVIEADDYTEIIDGNGQLFFVVENYPINTIDSISKNTWTITTPVWEALDSNSYSIDSKSWTVNLLFNLSRGFKNYQVVYNGGYTEIPAWLVLAVLKMASKYWNSRTSDGIKSESVAWDSISFDTTQIPNDILVVLETYRNL